ncbi:MAG: ABC transporter substrate-binding protein [Parvibaculaceae bacterium]
MNNHKPTGLRHYTMRGMLAAFAAPLALAAASLAHAEEPLKIGMIGDFVGQAGIYGQPSKNVGELAIADINAAGGVGGKPVALMFGEASSNPQQALSEAQRLVTVEGVQALAVTVGSSGCLAVKQGVAVPQKIPMFGTVCVSPVHTLDQKDHAGFFFRARSSIETMMAPIAKMAASDGVKRVCVMFVNNAYGQSAEASFKEAFLKLVPDGSVLSAGIPDATAASYLSELKTCTADGHDTVVAAAYGEGQSDVFMKEGLEYGLVKKFYFDEDQETPSLYEKLGWEPFDGSIGMSGSAIPGPGLDYFIQAYTAKYGAAPDMPLVEMNYDAVVLLALAAAKAGTADPTAIRAAIFEVANGPGEKIGPGVDELKKALALIKEGKPIDYIGVTGMNDYDDRGENRVGGAKFWHIDAKEKKIVTDGFVRYDRNAGTFEFLPSKDCKICKPF